MRRAASNSEYSGRTIRGQAVSHEESEVIDILTSVHTRGLNEMHRSRFMELKISPGDTSLRQKYPGLFFRRGLCLLALLAECHAHRITFDIEDAIGED